MSSCLLHTIINNTIAGLTFDQDVVGMVLWNQSVWLHTVILLLPLLFIDPWSTASTLLAHLFLHTLQTLVQFIPLQQARQLVLGEVSWMLKVKWGGLCVK